MKRRDVAEGRRDRVGRFRHLVLRLARQQTFVERQLVGGLARGSGAAPHPKAVLPIAATQSIQDRPANLVIGEGHERRALRRLESVDRRREPGHPHGAELVERGGEGVFALEAIGDRLHEREALLDELVSTRRGIGEDCCGSCFEGEKGCVVLHGWRQWQRPCRPFRPLGPRRFPGSEREPPPDLSGGDRSDLSAPTDPRAAS